MKTNIKLSWSIPGLRIWEITEHGFKGRIRTVFEADWKRRRGFYHAALGACIISLNKYNLLLVWTLLKTCGIISVHNLTNGSYGCGLLIHTQIWAPLPRKGCNYSVVRRRSWQSTAVKEVPWPWQWCSETCILCRISQVKVHSALSISPPHPPSQRLFEPDLYSSFLSHSLCLVGQSQLLHLFQGEATKQYCSGRGKALKCASMWQDAQIPLLFTSILRNPTTVWGPSYTLATVVDT